MNVASNFLVSLSVVVCGICMLIGLLGALQAIESMSLVASAIIQSGKELSAIAVMLVCIMPLVAVLLYIRTIADERLKLPSHLASSSFLGLVLGTTHTFPSAAPCTTSVSNEDTNTSHNCWLHAFVACEFPSNSSQCV
jgi:hypothetical protein